MTIAAFAALAVAGTLVRAVLTAGPAPGSIPWRTLGVNTVGALLLGLVVGASFGPPPVALAVAGLGSLTTFSTVAGETASLVDDGRARLAIAYVGLTVIVGVAAAALGISIGDMT